jgi:membrane associated rhomboid family serine protease
MVPLTPWVKRLLVANLAVYLLVNQGLAPNPMGLFRNLAFIPVPEIFLARPWTGITYQFLHGSFGHIFFNMIALYFFGPRLEERMGGGHFIALYLLSGFGGAVLSLLFQGGEVRPIVGASGAVYGVLMAYAVIWPRTVIHIWAILPVQAWVLAVFMVAVSLFSGFGGTGGNVAHFAHLGGLAVGFGYLRIWEWKKGSARREFQRKLNTIPGNGGGVTASFSGDGAMLSRWERIDVEGLHELNREEVVHLLQKARIAGVKSLSVSERQFLDRMAQAGN